MRYPLGVAEMIKRKCGKYFLTEVSMSGIDPENEPGLADPLFPGYSVNPTYGIEQKLP